MLFVISNLPCVFDSVKGRPVTECCPAQWQLGLSPMFNLLAARNQNSIHGITNKNHYGFVFLFCFFC